TYYTYYLNNGEKISCNEKDYKSEIVKKGDKKIFYIIIKTPNGVKKFADDEVNFQVSKKYFGHKLAYRSMYFYKKIDGYDKDRWDIILKTKNYFLAYMPKKSTDYADGATEVSRERIYFIFDMEKNVLATIEDKKGAEKYFTEYFPNLTNWHAYLKSINYDISLANWSIVDLASEILAPKNYKSDPVVDNQYYSHSLGTKMKIKKMVKEVKAFAPAESPVSE
ncbi:MAG: hypothetical protein RIQ33_2128, partial [Bacteroidota bacterium]